MNIYSKGDIIEILCNPKDIKRTTKYSGQPAEVLIAIGDDAVLVKFDDGIEFTIENVYVQSI